MQGRRDRLEITLNKKSNKWLALLHFTSRFVADCSFYPVKMKQFQYQCWVTFLDSAHNLPFHRAGEVGGRGWHAE
jgi:hypothetical protein